jgi:hypothetical protein
MIKEDTKELFELGAWLGRHQAFGMFANRCSAADAECLKQMRDGGHYKKLGMTWAKFCDEKAGISRVYANRLIDYLEEFGANYFRLSEVIQISGETYRLIAGAVSEEGLEVDGKKDSIDSRESEEGAGGGGDDTREGAAEDQPGYHSPAAGCRGGGFEDDGADRVGAVGVDWGAG